MGDEWVVAVFSAARPVEVDGTVTGLTNEAFIVQRGTHLFDLGAPPNYEPPSITCSVAGTTQSSPLILTFKPAMAQEESAVEAPAARPSKPRRARRKKP